MPYRNIPNIPINIHDNIHDNIPITSTVRKIRFVSDPRSTQDNVQVSVQLNDAIYTDLSRLEQFAQMLSKWCSSAAKW